MLGVAVTLEVKEVEVEIAKFLKIEKMKNEFHMQFSILIVYFHYGFIYI